MTSSESPSNLAEWLHRVESLHPSEIDLGLARIAQVSRQMKLPAIAKKVITVAGTNGKGSTVCMLSTILAAAGYKVGAYTSPHLVNYNERVRINGKPVSDESLCEAFERVDAARQDVSLTYFEFGALTAFDVFSRSDLDVAVLEVGLGGRLDAVNLIDPDVAVLTTIALDHTDWLGETREEIGVEKAGIFRAGAPAICGETDLPLTVINHAQALSADLMRRGEVYDFIKHADEHIEGMQVWDWSGSRGHETISFQNLPIPSLPLVNAATTLQALHQLKMDIPEQAIREGLMSASLPGRYQRIDKPVPMLLDVAHNPEAAAYLVERLKEEKHSGRFYALLGMLSDKDSDEVLNIMQPVIDEWAVCDLATPRAIAATALQAKLAELGDRNVKTYATPSMALDDLVTRVGNDDLLIVFGSFFTVGAVLEALSFEP